jgi:hypothetical protein
MESSLYKEENGERFEVLCLLVPEVSGSRYDSDRPMVEGRQTIS